MDTAKLNRAADHARSAFSLIELLVVVSIIAMLIAIVMPSLASSRDAARHAQCTHNLSQSYKALQGYRQHANSNKKRAIASSLEWTGFVNRFNAGGALWCPMDQSKGIWSPDGFLYTFTEPPASIKFNEHESNSMVFGFLEQEGLELTSALATDISQPGYYDNKSQHTAGSVPAGTKVDVWFLHYDPIDRSHVGTGGTISMGSRILGLICQTASLNATDGILGAPGVVYSSGQNARGFENGAERITLTEDMHTLRVDRFLATFPGEEIRVIVESKGNGGGASSYGMNNQVHTRSWPRGGQILLAEFGKAVIDVDFTGDNNDDYDEYLTPRHYGKTNTLFGDGSIELLTEDELDPERSIWKVDPKDGLP